MDDLRRAIHDIQHHMVALNAKADASEARFDRVDAKIDSVEQRVTMVDDAIRGNGSPGLRAAHQSLESRVEGISTLLRWCIGVVTTLGTAVAVWAITG